MAEEILLNSVKLNNLYGYRKMKLLLERESGKKTNRKKVYRIMAILGIQSEYRQKSRKRGFLKKNKVSRIAPNELNRNFNSDRPNEKWCTDVQEMDFTFEGKKLYVCNVIDLYDGCIVGYACSFTNDTNLSRKALLNAFEDNPEVKECLLHSDQGGNFTTVAYQKLLDEHGMIPSMSRAGKCIDNCVVESFHSVFKGILPVLHPEIRSMEELKKAVDQTFHFYNHEYLQERFGTRTHMEVRQEALESDHPKPYPIKPNPKIIAFKEWLEHKKAESS